MDMSVEGCTRVLEELSAIKFAAYAILGVVVVSATGTALRTYRYIRQLSRDKLDDVFRSEAQALLEKNKLDKLIELTQEKITERPNHTYAHWYLGRAYYLKADWQKAGEELAVVGQLAPDWQDGYVTPFLQEIQKKRDSVDS